MAAGTGMAVVAPSRETNARTNPACDRSPTDTDPRLGFAGGNLRRRGSARRIRKLVPCHNCLPLYPSVDDHRSVPSAAGLVEMHHVPAFVASRTALAMPLGSVDFQLRTRTGIPGRGASTIWLFPMYIAT